MPMKGFGLYTTPRWKQDKSVKDVNMEGVIFDIKRYAIHDGPGIRTTVFLKGCPLRCAWCHNPESQQFGIEILGSVSAKRTVGYRVSTQELVSEIDRDTLFYDESDGGVTFSGGEPLAQFEFLADMLEQCRQIDIHCAVDTSGHAPQTALLQVAKLTNLVLFDIKLMNDAKHLRYTGVDPGLIRDNLYALCEVPVDIEVRYPVIPGINDTAVDMEYLRSFMESLPRRVPLRLLPYHQGAMDKHRRFDMDPPIPDTPEPTREEMDRLRSIVKLQGLEIRE